MEELALVVHRDHFLEPPVRVEARLVDPRCGDGVGPQVTPARSPRAILPVAHRRRRRLTRVSALHYPQPRQPGLGLLLLLVRAQRPLRHIVLAPVPVLLLVQFLQLLLQLPLHLLLVVLVLVLVLVLVVAVAVAAVGAVPVVAAPRRVLGAALPGRRAEGRGADALTLVAVVVIAFAAAESRVAGAELRRVVLVEAVGHPRVRGPGTGGRGGLGPRRRPGPDRAPGLGVLGVGRPRPGPRPRGSAQARQTPAGRGLEAGPSLGRRGRDRGGGAGAGARAARLLEDVADVEPEGRGLAGRRWRRRGARRGPPGAGGRVQAVGDEAAGAHAHGGEVGPA
jgi:hypothetical protein